MNKGDAEHRRLRRQVDHLRRTNPDYKGKDGPGVPWPEGWTIEGAEEGTLSREAQQLKLWLEGRHEPLSDEELEHWVKAAPMVLAQRQQQYELDYERWRERARDWHEEWDRPQPPLRPKHWEPLGWCVYRIVEGYRPDGARADATSPCRCPYCLSVPERKARYDAWMVEFKALPASVRKRDAYHGSPPSDIDD